MTKPDAAVPDERPIPCISLADDFSYTADGRTSLTLVVGDKVDVAPQHYLGLLGAGMIEPAPGTDAGEARLAAEAALALPAQERLRRKLAAEVPPTARRAKPTAD